jgi:hypothetical protein
VAQRIGEFLVEVAGTGVEVRLEDGCNLAVFVELLEALGTCRISLGWWA